MRTEWPSRTQGCQKFNTDSRGKRTHAPHQTHKHVYVRINYQYFHYFQYFYVQDINFGNFESFEPWFPNPEFRVPSPESQVPGPESRVLTFNPEYQVPHFGNTPFFYLSLCAIIANFMSVMVIITIVSLWRSCTVTIQWMQGQTKQQYHIIIVHRAISKPGNQV